METTSVIETAESVAPQPQWQPASRIAFRFVFAYFVLYMLIFPAGAMIPYTSYLVEKYYDLLHVIVPWVGKHILRLSKEITIFTNGSGDTTYDYALAAFFLMLAALAMVIWSLADRRRAHYQKLYGWFRLCARFWTAQVMIVYGAAKVIDLQFGDPALAKLVQPYGEASPMGILWTFMASSDSYTFATGLAEVIAGVLLLIPRTTLLGALATLVVMGQVFLLNMTYDVPVKLFSFHVVLLAALLAAPDAKRLANLFLFNRPVAPAPVQPLFERQRLRQALLIGQVVFGLYLLGSAFYEARSQFQSMQAFGNPPLRGIWEVDELTVNGDARLFQVAEEARWQYLIFEFRKFLTVRTLKGPHQGFKLQLDTENHTLTLGRHDDPEWKAAFQYAEPEPERLTLQGSYNGHQMDAKLHRVDETKFMLKSRGFHWIQEFPFNR